MARLTELGMDEAGGVLAQEVVTLMIEPPEVPHHIGNCDQHNFSFESQIIV
ncbi:hypothetical protein FHS19_006009 [Paenibacillus rhizosphaerae]|uniref:Uncharacterized protein n=1 Tax=Paenibacillus rhizosphaerae TaxID=297318 RepID=A0A839U1F4_9BACL|nr:hypothetical protein [Paenibacillus rhizosphaerae]